MLGSFNKENDVNVDQVVEDPGAAIDEIERLQELISRAVAELETVKYENGPPLRVVLLMDELRAVNRDELLDA